MIGALPGAMPEWQSLWSAGADPGGQCAWVPTAAIAAPAPHHTTGLAAQPSGRPGQTCLPQLLPAAAAGPCAALPQSRVLDGLHMRRDVCDFPSAMKG